jgi:hypothetical protein
VSATTALGTEEWVMESRTWTVRISLHDTGGEVHATARFEEGHQLDHVVGLGTSSSLGGTSDEEAREFAATRALHDLTDRLDTILGSESGTVLARY